MLTDLCSKSKSLTVLRQIVCFVLSGHDWRITQSCTTSVRHRCGVSLNTVEQSILAVQHAVILASSFSPLKLGTITYEDTFLDFSVVVFHYVIKCLFNHHLVFYSYMDISSKSCKYCIQEPYKKLKWWLSKLNRCLYRDTDQQEVCNLGKINFHIILTRALCCF
jgi:hypothetical protein